jgi:hypothetical protein
LSFAEVFGIEKVTGVFVVEVVVCIAGGKMRRIPRT